MLTSRRHLPDGDGGTNRNGVALNGLTEAAWRDPISGAPWHKHVPARIEPLEAGAEGTT